MQPRPDAGVAVCARGRRRAGDARARFVVVALGVLALLLAGCGSRPAPAGPTRLTVEPSAAGPRVPASFLGLSVEWDSVGAYVGPGGEAVAGLRRLLAPVGRAQRSPLALRIGGDTGDQAWWNPRGRPRPPTVLQDVGPATLDAVARLARALGGPVALGLNLALRDPANARALVLAARQRLPPRALRDLEIGNEPDLYTTGRTFRRGGHLHRRLVKFSHYSTADYSRDVAAYLAVLGRLRPASRLDVGGFAGPGWWPVLPALARRPAVGALTAHLYAFPSCDAGTPSAAWLMSPAASSARVASLRPLAAIARDAHRPLRLTELGSAPCGGRPGLSDTPAAALWLTDTLFAVLRVGAAEADVHTWAGATYAPFAVTAGRVRPRPPLAGMRAFAAAAPAGSRVAAVTSHGPDAVRADATVAASGTVRVALLAPAGGRAVVAVRSAGRGSGRAAGGGRAPATAGTCARLVRFSPRPAPARRVCPRGGRYAVDLPPRAVSVLTVAREPAP